ncbi:hypothetical protein SAMN05216203_0005 [Marinobacter daqiaonensis]|uniref:Uncharacterized protein n=1 Tax=Marinobacter daqiaonensis TaxID=650891 RepID=A0A1I6GES9_9GAMM|nr:hypothetical protein [Marinobacter daqiaonensis]SFR40713.1 hypothetical protein SAMN05216203_0005 [Marinobacter daqiaonensis]
MFWNFVATIVCGLGAAGIAMGIRAATRNKAPRWLIPVFAGLGMMGFQIYMEYNWYDHMTTRMPPESVVVSTEAQAEFWRPWSFFYPQINRITVLDTSSVRRSAASPETVRLQLHHFRQTYGGRVSSGTWLLNCPSRELVALDENGKPDTSEARRLGPQDALFQRVCN